jgi:hypothetical protein
MLRLIEPFIAYGYPNLKSTRDIIYKRGFGKVTGQRIPLSANTVVEAGLGKLYSSEVLYSVVSFGYF